MADQDDDNPEKGSDSNALSRVSNEPDQGQMETTEETVAVKWAWSKTDGDGRG